MFRGIVPPAGAVFALLFFVSCGNGRGTGPDPFVERQIPAHLSADVSDVVESANRFAVDFYREIMNRKEGNLFCSPFSVSTALAMTDAGAAGETKAEMERVLRFSGNQENVHAAYGALVKSLDRGGALGGYRLNVANRLWGQTGYPFLETFLDVCANDYQAGFETLDFLMNWESARQTINLWVEGKTEERIKDLLPPGSVTRNTRLVLTNAIYFKGKWARQFDPKATTDQAFHRTGGEASVPMMYQKETFGYARGTDLSILEMKYVGEDLSMFVFLPDSIDGLADLEAGLTFEALEAGIAAVRDQKVIVYLPRFEFTVDFELNAVLAAMGMPSAFNPETADFSGMDGTRDLFIHGVFHKAFVKTNEEGTEAAAATGVVMGVTSAPNYPIFRADHPFLFLIRDNVTGAVLFMGRVADPLSKA
ncbi:MAG: serpin family protein [Candidatus Eisenbacteria bacterium]|nr:serpin family protein [Candidatus Eisenbacteria bacterium]